MDAVLGLREQKKAETELAIREVAIKLFLEQGYERTTIESIAEGAHVSARTVFRYFASKEEILLSGAEEEVATAIALFDAQPEDVPVMVALRDVVEQMVRSVREEPSTDIRVARLLDTEPVLRGRFLAMLEEIERSVTTWTAERLGMPDDHWKPRLVAACVMASYRVATSTAADTDADADLGEVLTEAISQLGRGFDEL